MTKVAVITRTKDRSIFLRRAIESVAAQTYDDYVHVIVNDGGEKSALEEIVLQLDAKVKDKIRVFHRNEPSNAPDTIFNESIDRVDSAYFAIHDDDDTWHPEFLSRTVRVLETDVKLAAVVVRTDKVIELNEGDSLKELKRDRWMPELKAINLYRQCIDNQFTPIATLFRRQAYESVGKFDSSLPVVGDWEFGIRLLLTYDADFLDPGYALAHYHHRQQRDNSFAAHDHRYYTNLVMNRYLRRELGEGKLGVGYIMSQNRYMQNYISRLSQKIMPTFVAKRLKRRAEQ